MRGARHRRRLGLSLFEAIVVLVISSMVLSIVLPLASRSIRDNVRIGARGLDAQQRALEEENFRRLVRGAVQRPPAVGETPNPNMLVGDADGFQATILAEAPAGCLGAGRIEDVHITINRNDEGLQIICATAERQTVLLSLDAGADAAFSYSWDGVEWSADWPDEAFLGANTQTIDLDRPTLPLIAAPLVRLSLAPPAGRPLAWVERAGRFAPVIYRREAFGTQVSAADQKFVP